MTWPSGREVTLGIHNALTWVRLNQEFLRDMHSMPYVGDSTAIGGTCS